MRKLLMTVGAAVFVFAVRADMLDLNGVDKTVTDLAELEEGATNSSDTMATLTISVSDDATLASTISGNIKLVKEGSGTLTLASATRTYTGGTFVSAGILKLADRNPTGIGSGDLTIADGAAVDLNGCLASTASGFPANVYAQGTGPANGGAIRNTGTQFGNNAIPHLYLTGDLLVNLKNRANVTNIHPQGKTFRLAGNQCSVNNFYNEQGGDISVEAGGTYTAFANNAYGTTKNKSTIYVRGGWLNAWVNGNVSPMSPVVVEEAGSQIGCRGTRQFGFYNSTLAINAPVIFKRNDSASPANFMINAQNTPAFTGSGLMTVDNYAAFYFAISTSQNAFSGPILNRGTFYIGAGARASMTSGAVTNSGTIAYNCAKDAVVSPSEIVGGTLSMPTGIDGGTLTINATHITNVTTRVYRNTLTLDGGAKVTGGRLICDQSEEFYGTLNLKECFVTNLTGDFDINRGTLTLCDKSKIVSPATRMNFSNQTAWQYTNTVATLNIENGSDTTLGYFNAGHGGDYKYTNVVDGVEVVYNNSFSGTINQTGGTLRTMTCYNTTEPDGIRLGHYTNARTTWNLSGGEIIVDEPYAFNMAISGQSTVNMSGGKLSAHEVNMSGRIAGTGFGIFNLTGGELNLGTGGFAMRSTRNPAYQINLGGGIVRASAAEGFTSALRINLTGTNGNTIFDTATGPITLSGAISGTGGLVKTGANTLTLSGADSYTGTTRIEGGSIAFAQAFPGGDIEISAELVNTSTDTLVSALSAAFSQGKEIRITNAELLDKKLVTSRRAVISCTTPIETLPSLKLIATDGTELDAEGKWTLKKSSDGKSLTFGPVVGFTVIVL